MSARASLAEGQAHKVPAVRPEKLTRAHQEEEQQRILANNLIRQGLVVGE